VPTLRQTELLQRKAANMNIHKFEESTMQPQADTITMDAVDEMPAATDGPSADFICKISQFLDTDPSDILAELGYYSNDEAQQAE
jgi:hypothetical protein